MATRWKNVPYPRQERRRSLNPNALPREFFLASRSGICLTAMEVELRMRHLIAITTSRYFVIISQPRFQLALSLRSRILSRGSTNLLTFYHPPIWHRCACAENKNFRFTICGSYAVIESGMISRNNSTFSSIHQTPIRTLSWPHQSIPNATWSMSCHDPRRAPFTRYPLRITRATDSRIQFGTLWFRILVVGE